ncbi:NAD(P)/FAD-dependent oxidoreductase [Ahrensia marina]|uniref:NAD(P)/FAD-dependent oxidoreductase n=1 Tax=Ahrensia marina TaxID=1514904 RepID=UPI0006B5D3D5|nr:FAD-dependent oxidoreductase [Ahrensia marina]
MTSYQNASDLPASSLKPDIAIIGGGIVGLWTAYYAGLSGQSVLLINKEELGRGASYGLLGALMPHQPINWNDKKQFQLDGLTTLPDQIANLQMRSEVDCGYFRCGRTMPIANEEKRKQSATWARGAKEHWVSPFDWSVQDKNPAEGWLSDTGSHGYNTDDLSARINPRGIIKALTVMMATFDNVTILARTSVDSIENTAAITLEDGTKIQPGKTIITAGFESFGLIKAITNRSLGWGVKGQAALLKPEQEINVSAPILYDGGTYVIAHEDGNIAVGSTSEREFTNGTQTDEKLDQIIASATALCPALEGAKVIERWAGIRPRAAGRDPLIGMLPDAPDVIVATGGFKITFAIAHIMARCALSATAGQIDAIPESFLVESHLSEA